MQGDQRLTCCKGPSPRGNKDGRDAWARVAGNPRGGRNGFTGTVKGRESIQTAWVNKGFGFIPGK